MIKDAYKVAKNHEVDNNYDSEVFNDYDDE